MDRYPDSREGGRAMRQWAQEYPVRTQDSYQNPAQQKTARKNKLLLIIDFKKKKIQKEKCGGICYILLLAFK